ncbi:flavin reductase family protein [Paenirhodobacter sp.]|uniref:flavin reductase family protein n=1 Tax=Paenirhodobacter sp. TaxID=1965326 RepID=UPI003B401892
MTTDPQAITIPAFWTALGARAISATIVTTSGEGGPQGFVALSATHFSATPPLVTVSVSATTSALAGIRASGVFAVNFLSREGRAVYDRFAAKDAPKGAARFEGLDYGALATGAPVFAATTGALDCRFEEAIERDGATLIFGRIVDFIRHEQAEPLIHFAGRLQD